MMIVMLFMIKSMTISDCLGNISDRETSSKNSLTDIQSNNESNNLSIEKISDINETSIISNDETFEVLLNKRHSPSISHYETTQTILDNQKILFRRKQKNKIPIRYKRHKPSNETAVGKKDTPPLYYTALFKETNATSVCSFSFDKKVYKKLRRRWLIYKNNQSICSISTCLQTTH